MATRALLRPLSASACERIFSYLTQMDAADRSLTSKATLRMELYLRGNWKILEQLRDEWHTEKLAGRLGRVEEMQRKRLEERSATANAALAAARAARGGGAHRQGLKRARAADGDEGDALEEQEDAVDGDGADGEPVE